MTAMTNPMRPFYKEPHPCACINVVQVLASFAVGKALSIERMSRYPRVLEQSKPWLTMAPDLRFKDVLL
jgi:hypothetical protein